MARDRFDFREIARNLQPPCGSRREKATGKLAICNLSSMTKREQAIRELTKALVDKTGNLPPLPGIVPDYAAPITDQGKRP